ncbi:fibronectin type III domain-containing protein [Treponema sp.]|uniref:fibronectin type III domain-containing protein n=1 Tax=Treponema sp. TaxID=166 RepID=UPI0025F1DBEF|nr:fibronectin type III domain-containing protein [Treponema sp.]MCR5219341.1 fibronectin type III domain-containing protein [Treponema sp.]
MKKLLKSASLLLAAAFVFASCDVSETELTVQSDRGLVIQALELSQDNIYLYGNKGVDTVDITATYYPEAAQDTYIKWTSSDEDIVTVSEDTTSTCTITLQGEGSAVVTATTYSGKVSASCTVTTSLSSTVPFAPTAISLTPYSNNIEVEWTNASVNADALEGILVYVYEGSDNTGTKVLEDILEGSGSGASCSGRINQLSSSTEYYVEAYAKTVNGYISDDCITATTTTAAADITAPDAVTDLAVVSITSSTATISWTASASSDLQYYLIYAYDSDGNKLSSVTADASATTAVLSDVAAEDIVFTVKVYSVDDNYNISAPASIEYENGEHVSDLTVSHSTSYSGILNMTWTDPESDFDHIKVTVVADGEDPVSVDNIAAGTESCSISGLTPDALYTVCVALVDSEGQNIGISSTEAHASKIEIRFYSSNSSGFMVVTSAYALKTQSGSTAAYKYKWLKMPALDGSTTYDFSGTYDETGSTYSIMAQTVNEEASGLYLYMTEADSSNGSGAEAPVTIADESTITSADKISFATFFNAKSNASGTYALRFVEDYYQLGSASSVIRYRYSSGSPGYAEWQWTVTEEDSTTED